MKTERLFGRRTRQTEETDKYTRHVAEFAGMCAECRGDVSHPAESGQDRFKALEPNFVFVAKCRPIRIGYNQQTGKFCRRQMAQPIAGCAIRSFRQLTYRHSHQEQTIEFVLHRSAEGIRPASLTHNSKRGRSDSFESDRPLCHAPRSGSFSGCRPHIDLQARFSGGPASL